MPTAVARNSFQFRHHNKAIIARQHVHPTILRSCLSLTSRVNICELENALDTEIHQFYLDIIYYQSLIIGGFNKLSIATPNLKNYSAIASLSLTKLQND